MTQEAVETSAASLNESDTNDNDLINDDEYDSYFDEFSSASDGGEPGASDVDELENADEEAAPAKQAEPATGAQADDDPWKDAPETLRSQYQALREQNQKLENEARAHMGRSNAFQRKTQELEKKLQQKAAVAEEADTSLTLEDVPEEFRESFSEEELKAFLKVAELAAAKKAGKLEGTVAELRESQTQAEVARAQIEKRARHDDFKTQLDSQIDGWRELDKDPGFKAFLQAKDPVTDLPRQQLFVDAYQDGRIVGVANLYRQYKESRGDDAAGKDNQSDKRREILARNASQPVKQGGGKTTTLSDDDYDTAFDHYSRKADRNKR